ncbi:MAG TPA: protein kinase [Sandaracinaceae bacterium LLY-WYZ-13_1]|nr:protein kinase [Sandaracinaceae bacterium LLY-WYZ-13_1]
MTEAIQTPRHRVGSDDAADPLADTAATPRGPASDPDAGRTEASDPRLGTSLAHFRIDAPLGRGGMGAVYRGWDRSLERPVAIKVLTVEHPQARERFLREARAQAKVRHPNVVPIHYVGTDDGTVFLSMDLVEGASVDDRLRAGPMDVDEALDIADAVAEALAEGQKSGLVHRDVKPSNVLCTRDGRVLLADFGLAKAVGGPDDAGEGPGEGAGAANAATPALTHRGAIVGTPAYMAPEQTRAGPLDHRADMYALGVTLYEMVTGQRPFTAPDAAALLLQHREERPLPPRTIAPSLPPSVDALIQRLLAKDPADRFADYAALRAAIADARVRPAPSAGFFARTGAMTIDLLVTVLLAIPVAIVYEPLIWPLAALAWGLAEARWGRTLGKRLFALRVVGEHDHPPSMPRALLRNVVKHWGPVAISGVRVFFGDAGWMDEVTGVGVLLWIGSFLVAAGARKLGLHDRASGTRVVYDLKA